MRTAQKENKIHKEKRTNERERWVLLFLAKHGVGRKSQTFQQCPRLLCRKASVHNPTTCLWVCEFSVSEGSSLSLLYKLFTNRWNQRMGETKGRAKDPALSEL